MTLSKCRNDFCFTEATASDKWSLTPKILFSCFGFKYECFYSNVKIGRFKVTSHFWKTVLKSWIDNKCDVPNANPNTALWNNGRVMFFSEIG